MSISSNLRETARSLAASRTAPTPNIPGLEFVPYGKSGIEVAVAQPAVSMEMKEKVRKGWYESTEAANAAKLLQENEVVLDLGAGLGLISTILAKSGKATAIHCFEADERLIPLIHETHRKNDVTISSIYNEAIVADPEMLERGYLEFHLRANFWGNSFTSRVGRTVEQVVRVPVRPLSAILEELRPTVIIADVEGAEDGLFTNTDLSSVKRISLEVHPNTIGPDGVRRLFADIHGAGFYYDVTLSHGAVPTFSRG